jgi:hypothetical protein
METLEDRIRVQATQWPNGRWTFESKDTHSWTAEADHLRRVAERDQAPQYEEYAAEAARIAAALAARDAATVAQCAALPMIHRAQAQPHTTHEEKTMHAKPFITRAQVEQLRAQGHVAYIYPRKKIVCVDGSKYYTLKG